MKKTNVNNKTKLFIIVYSIICVGLISWYFVLQSLVPLKLEIKTYNIDLQESISGEQEPLIDVVYYNNKNNNGLEMFEVRWNSYSDDNKTEFNSLGFQYVANNKIDSLNWETFINSDYPRKKEKIKQTLWAETYYMYSAMSYRTDNNSSAYYYCSSDNYYTSLNNSELGIDNKYFRIEVDGELYLIQFKGADYSDENFFVATGEQDVGVNYYDHDSTFFGDTFYFAYYSKDFSYLNHLLFESVQGVAGGTEHYYKFNFGNLFNFYEQDSNGTYSEDKVAGDKLNKLLQLSETNVAIKIKVVDDGARYATDSLFDKIKGNQNFNLTGDYQSEDYFYGRDVIKLNVTNFDFVQVTENIFALKLNKKTMNNLEKYINDIVLEINIDLKVFNNLNYIFAGFSEDSGLDKFNVYRAYTTNLDGTITEVVV